MKFGKSLVLAVAGIALASGGAFAFGTVEGVMGQNREHERITRHALSCEFVQDKSVCFDALSMDELAGKSKTWGAVGAPDNPARGFITNAAAHCDDGDYVDVQGYPNTQAAARDALIACRTLMNQNMNKAVIDAAGLLTSKGVIDDSQIPTTFTCTYLGQSGRAKCNVMEDFGLVLHASQDFYSHSNWSDEAKGGTPISLSNPKGLNNPGPAPWLNLRVANPQFPDGLISGCFDKTSIVSPAKGCPGHVKHEDLNKDTGPIDPMIRTGTTTRGAIGTNFSRAVNAAILDTQDKWADLRERLVTMYGAKKGALMACAIMHDNPSKVCK